MRSECYFCISKTVERLVNKQAKTEQDAVEFISDIHNMLTENWDKSNPLLATHIHRTAKKVLKNDNLYEQEKKHANSVLLDNYDYWKNIVESSENPLYMAAKLAVAGNVIDYGANSAPTDIESKINEIIKKDFAIDNTKELFEKINSAKTILYLGDNAGEVVFDKLFIETMQHKNVIFAVRGTPVINDITIEDAKDIGMDRVCRVITNGFDAPSTLLKYCSDEFIEEYNSADLIISKGQGNFEGLIDEKQDNLFFMLMAKCNTMAELLGVKKYDLVVKQSSANSPQ